jgi:hypothetical protein
VRLEVKVELVRMDNLYVRSMEATRWHIAVADPHLGVDDGTRLTVAAAVALADLGREEAQVVTFAGDNVGDRRRVLGVTIVGAETLAGALDCVHLRSCSRPQRVKADALAETSFSMISLN